jgi:hypothetical protein
MRKVYIGLLAALTVSVATAQDANLLKYVTLVNPTASASVTGTGVDVAAYKGNARVLVDFGVVAAVPAYTGIVTIATSVNNSTWRTVTNLAGTVGIITKRGSFTNSAPEGFAIDAARLSRYLRASIAQYKYTNSVGVKVVFPFKAE